MKLKNLIIVAATGMLAASFAYAAPASDGMTDDTSTMQSTPSAQEPNIGSLGANSPASADMGVPGPASSNSMPDTQMPMESSANSDDMSADTATGDDDY